MRRKSSRAVVAALTIIGLLVAYPLSIGPAWFLFHYFDWGPFTNVISDGLLVFYSPLNLLPDPLDTWVAEWWTYGGDLGIWAREGD